ncbi:DNA gyrase inhibitor YacG [Marinomonas mediterranea]|jgi:Uncharacterized protein conserved in bacteria|uniref:DNA gyrase inhibitor YacG n=1 Tax=Marinomonas mediterranea (strain ATCC 700492 / JCM 21426 / NBRC 103028 / MMB-1) TaxID=717774 RepID=F2K3D6_MARM1|nr:DNA gyrase inhibitor YacG [Marinomonas mediterranea]ADZ91278.1 UPF0243 zinc-binding protein yacG [Marinomonas mediterranea MMB-1]WCN09249.1 DNA gyrase inhibitor YacG [Marinomonas mediterranea]WCN13331.1 DNA gyrase inhibitor YacG [Marinomonas mediterranea]WCN17399.1 DNA gyrase inhibitor YacG [Marinomonas mediterranea MMB-1]
MSSSESTPRIACPTCGTKSPWSTKNQNRPFCSDRCKLIDLGEWANESYAIPQQTSEEDEIFSEDLVVQQNRSFL